MSFHRPWWPTGVAIAALMALGACTTKGAGEAEMACPSSQIAVPSDRFGHSDDEGRIRYVATIEQLVSDCRINEDYVAVDLAFNVKAERGPVFEDQPINLTYYIATIDPSRVIVDKQLLNVVMALEPEQAESVVREELTLHLPLPDEATGSNYNLYLGFQPET